METRIFDPSVIFSTIPALLPFLSVTLGVAFSSVILGSLLGLLLAWAKLGKNKVLRSLAHAYTYIMRCTPSIVLLFIVFYGLPKFTYEYLDYDINDISRAYFAILTFVLLLGPTFPKSFGRPFPLSPKGSMKRPSVWASVLSRQCAMWSSPRRHSLPCRTLAMPSSIS